MSRIDYSKFNKKDRQLIINMYPSLGTKIISEFNLSFTKEEVRKMARKLGVKKIVRRWTISEDKIICKCYLKDQTPEYANKLFKRVGVEPRTESSIKAKMCNYKYLHTGEGGYYGYSKQAKEVYIETTGNHNPYLKPNRREVINNGRL